MYTVVHYVNSFGPGGSDVTSVSAVGGLIKQFCIVKQVYTVEPFKVQRAVSNSGKFPVGMVLCDWALSISLQFESFPLLYAGRER